MSNNANEAAIKAETDQMMAGFTEHLKKDVGYLKYIRGAISERFLVLQGLPDILAKTVFANENSVCALAFLKVNEMIEELENPCEPV